MLAEVDFFVDQFLQALSLSLKDVTGPSPTILFNVREQISEMAWVRGYHGAEMKWLHPSRGQGTFRIVFSNVMNFSVRKTKATPVDLASSI